MKINNLFIILISILFFSFKPEEKPITIFMIGDSTMANKDLKDGNIERGWGQMLHLYVKKGAVVENHAKDGRSTKSFIDEGRWNEVLSKLKKGDYVFIQFGHNDEKPAMELHTDPGSSFDENLRRFVRETREKGATPILFNSIVRRNFPPEGFAGHKGSYEKEGNILVDTHGDYLYPPKKVAQEMGVVFIDMNKITYDLVTKMGVEKSKKLFMWVPANKYKFCPNGKVDNSHLNIYGAKRVAKLAAAAVAKSTPEIRQYISCSYK